MTLKEAKDKAFQDMVIFGEAEININQINMTETDKMRCLETCLQYEMKRQGSDLKVEVGKYGNEYYVAWFKEGTDPKEGHYNTVYDIWAEYAIEELFKHTYYISLIEGADDDFYRKTLSALDIKSLK